MSSSNFPPLFLILDPFASLSPLLLVEVFIFSCLTGSPQGAPESVIERCQYLRVGTAKMLLTPALRDQLLSKIREWGTGRDTLRCLALATRDQPPRPADMDLVNSPKFAEYEVEWRRGLANGGWLTGAG